MSSGKPLDYRKETDPPKTCGSDNAGLGVAGTRPCTGRGELGASGESGTSGAGHVVSGSAGALGGPSGGDSCVETLFAGRFLHLCRAGRWEYVHRPGITGLVVIIAVTDEGGLVLTEQFRPPMRARVIELPAGLAGDVPGQDAESLEVAAHRELLEETGYDAGLVRLLTEGPPSPGASNEFVSFFLAQQLRKVGDGGGDQSEDIVTHVVPLDDVAGWLEDVRRGGCVQVDPKTYAGLYFALQARAGGA